ncbi:sporulation protein YqfD [Desulfotomaculum copahuensis]|nr:sporulation protein YqfD [Desulfotomaculum copahuensis]
MFLFKLLSYLVGYVSIAIRGEHPEKFINMAAIRGICLWDIRRLGENCVQVNVRLSAVHPLRHIARQTGCRFRTTKRRGMPFLWMRVRRRRAMLPGALLFVLGLYMLGSFVWFIDVTGNHRLNKAEILAVADAAGLHRGMPKWDLDPDRVEKAVREQLPGVSWAGVYVKGTKVTIQVVEAALPGKISAGPAHIVAQKAGVIKEMLVLAGHPAVKEGETVLPGQILISGIVPPPEEPKPPAVPPGEAQPAPKEPAYVHALGTVRARVWYEGYGEAPLVESGRRPTGRTETRICMKIGSREIILFGPRKIPYALYEKDTSVKELPEWRNLRIPVELITEKYRELENYREVRDRESARRLAMQKAMQSVQAQMPPGDKILRRQFTDLVVKQPENLVRVKLFVECLEDIGVEKPFTPVPGPGASPLPGGANPPVRPPDGIPPAPAGHGPH